MHSLYSQRNDSFRWYIQKDYNYIYVRKFYNFIKKFANVKIIKQN